MTPDMARSGGPPQTPVPDLSARAARNLMLAAQGLDRRPRPAPGKQDVLSTVRRMGALQIDSIQVVARSPYLVLFSRLGKYDPRWLDELLEEGRLFEYWSHEACLLPIEDYPLYWHRMKDPESLRWKYSATFLDEHADLVRQVRDRIRLQGPVRSADFRRRDRSRSSWWGWKAEKRILEYLLTSGELMVKRREGFQRLYDLRDRVLPNWDSALAPPREEALASLIERTVIALGITRTAWVADYFRIPKKDAIQIVTRLTREKALIPVVVEGWDTPGLVHPENLELVFAAAGGKIRPVLTTLLSPFDPLVWDRARAHELFGFDYKLECYTPPSKRRFGYFVLPVLRRGALVGRLDAKAHRAEGLFEVRALFLEPNSRRSNALARDLVQALCECASWHGTPEVTIRSVCPADFTQQLRSAAGTVAPAISVC